MKWLIKFLTAPLPVVQLLTLCILCYVLPHNSVQCEKQVNNKLLDTKNLRAVFEQQELASSPAPQTTCSNDSSCPSWFYCSKPSNTPAADDNGLGVCTSGKNHHHKVICSEDLAPQACAVLVCYCVTTNDQGKAVLGACFANCANLKNSKMNNHVYHKLSNSKSELNNDMCGSFNRNGTLCGQCKNNHYPQVYSFHLKCVPCPEGKKNIWKYILIAYGPLTFFYFFVLFFKINANSSHLHGFVLFSQVVSVPMLCRVAIRLSNKKGPLVVLQVLLTLFGIWNLDFFRSVMPETICLQTDTLQTLALDYGIAVYPLVLIIISYVMIELHDRNFRIVVFIWRPFRFIFTFFRRNWDSRTSVIDAYATFFLLAYMKFLSVSFDLLNPTRLYELNSNKITYVLYYDGSIEYFGKEHLPYAILALAVLLLFIILPTAVLLLYPFRWFQKFLNCFPIRWHILHTFVDSFQGCYKDGTEPGTRDCRWFAAVFLLIRFLGFFTYAGTSGSGYFSLSIIFLASLLFLLIAVQPFKHEVAHYTRINAMFIICLALITSTTIGGDLAIVKEEWLVTTFSFLGFIFAAIPLLYISCIAIHWLVSHRKWGKEFIQRLRAWRQGYNWWELEEDLENSLPDRTINPRQYHEGNLSNFSIQGPRGYESQSHMKHQGVPTY